jgi:hypothetical protein
MRNCEAAATLTRLDAKFESFCSDMREEQTIILMWVEFKPGLMWVGFKPGTLIARDILIRRSSLVC